VLVQLVEDKGSAPVEFNFDASCGASRWIRLICICPHRRIDTISRALLARRTSS